MSKEQTALERIKDEVAKEKGFSGWRELYLVSGFPFIIKILEEEVYPKYIGECCQATLENGWILSRERMPDVDGDYLIYGFMHTECGNVYPFQKVVTCRFNQWVKSDVGEQMTYWRPLLPPPIIKSNEELFFDSIK